MKRLLHKNLWKAGLAVLAMMLLPTGGQADTYVSTITRVEEVQSPETQGHYYLLSTTEKNDWTLNSAAEYANDANYAILNTENSISLNSLFQVSGTILSVTVECQSSDGGTFSLSTADVTTADGTTADGTSITYSYEIGSADALTTYSFTPDEGSFETENTSLTLTYNSNSGGNLNISKITITTGVLYHIALFNGEDAQENAKKVVVSDLNYRDVLGDGTVSYNPTTSTLVLNNASFGSSSGSMECSLPSLNIQLLGSNTMKSAEGFIFFPEATTAGNLTFLTDENNPGSLSFINYYDQGGSIEEEMLFSGVEVTYQNGLSLNAIYDDNPEMSEATAYVIRSNQAIKPIINEEDPDRDIVIVGTIYGDLDGKVISDVYYTLTSDEGCYDNSDGTNGVVVKVGMSDAEVEAAIEAGKPGTPAFDAKFRGITMMVPAGIGTVTIKAKGSAEGAVLKTKLGAAAAVARHLTTDYADYVVEYQCTVATYLYIYVLDQEPAPARPGGPNREKVQTTTVKITGYKGNSAAVVNSVGGVQTASVYSLSCTGYKAGDDHVTMSTVEVAAVAAARPVGGPMHTPATTVSYPISSLGESVFAEADKDKLLYIDLSGTQVKGIDVNRSSGIFNGINIATTIYLPDGNNDAGEPNVIINGECKTLNLDDSKTFKAPAGKTFKVNKVTLTRTTHAFVKDKPATVFLPFNIPADQASKLGTFHTFKVISGDNAVFNTAESGDIAANTPYIFVPNNDGANITATDVTLNTTVPVASGELIGTYERIDWTTDPGDIYGFSATDQNGLTQGQFFKVKASSYILPFRAYLKVTAAPSRLRLVIGDDTTGITTISNPENEDNIWYSLDGQRHQGKPAKQGVYIRNNQKVLVK